MVWKLIILVSVAGLLLYLLWLIHNDMDGNGCASY